MDTAVNICRALVTGVLSHGITIYGWSSRTNIAKIDVATNKCFRTATGLLRATPIDSLRVEGRFSCFYTLLEKFSVNMASRAITLPSDGLHELFWKHLSSRNEVSSIGRILQLLSDFNIAIPPRPSDRTFSNGNLFIDYSLSTYGKNITGPAVYRSLLAERITYFSPQTILYTDGSFDGINTSFSVVKKVSATLFETISETRLPDRIGIFSAELAAVISAMTFASGLPGRTLICTDSLSVVKALSFNRKGVFNYVLPPTCRDKVTILWIPSHMGIEGNERADEIAKRALHQPGISVPPCFHKSITSPYNSIKAATVFDQWNRSEVFLRTINPSGTRPDYNKLLTRADCIFLTRLRVNKTIFNTRHYYERTDPARCVTCNNILSVRHILSECPLSRINQPLESILDCSISCMLSKIRTALRAHGDIDI